MIQINDINSPVKFKVNGAPQFPSDNIKNKIENNGHCLSHTFIKNWSI